MFSLAGRKAIVTGAAGGIGRAVAERFIAGGAQVIITDIVDATDVAEEIGADFIRMDVGSSQDVAAGFQAAAERLRRTQKTRTATRRIAAAMCSRPLMHTGSSSAK